MVYESSNLIEEVFNFFNDDKIKCQSWEIVETIVKINNFKIYKAKVQREFDY